MRLARRRSTNKAAELHLHEAVDMYSRLLTSALLPPHYPCSGWREAPTGLGKPLYGPSGFGNRRNAYIWSAEVFNNELYFGTFDTTTSTQVVAAGGSASPMLIGGEAGADLFKFKNTSSPAVAVTRTGFGNPGNFGFRNLVVGALCKQH